MLHNEARKLLAEAYEQTRDAQTAAKCFRMSTSTVYRLSMQRTWAAAMGGPLAGSKL